MNNTAHTKLTRKEWYAALLFAHGATPNESANALLVHPSKAEQLARVARDKLGARSRSQLRRALAA
jgi:DNA-binding CsgD family transcriptional regulator